MFSPLFTLDAVSEKGCLGAIGYLKENENEAARFERPDRISEPPPSLRFRGCPKYRSDRLRLAEAVGFLKWQTGEGGEVA